jgi:LysM repeat protein
MSEEGKDAGQFIDAYRRRQRIIPLVLGGLAVVLLVVGVFMIIIWLSGGGAPDLLAFLASPTPTATMTSTPRPPTATATITLTPTPSNTPTPEGPRTYIVEIGDSLTSIAERFEVSVELIIAYNELEDPNNVPVGTELIIPPPDAELPTETPLPEDLKTGDKIRYKVKTGDTLASIAERFNTTVEAIAEENEIEDLNSIGVGTILIITIGPTPTPTLTPLPATATATPTP